MGVASLPPRGVGATRLLPVAGTEAARHARQRTCLLEAASEASVRVRSTRRVYLLTC
jgi:hypothetical protein